jgi:hypothetical protein
LVVIPAHTSSCSHTHMVYVLSQSALTPPSPLRAQLVGRMTSKQALWSRKRRDWMFSLCPRCGLHRPESTSEPAARGTPESAVPQSHPRLLLFRERGVRADAGGGDAASSGGATKKWWEIFGHRPPYFDPLFSSILTAQIQIHHSPS